VQIQIEESIPFVMALVFKQNKNVW